ncbi:hypothetical protein ROZALSC1DRAFT_29329 [Rozella allomycis CSF55]|uniref:ShKT domain-containing protein n=1 Tax=Rozella allomycis (strain CSF55) TaxID=988480 RepID=A0A075AN93_ROZAC|nr:hypothetical protein O9G_000907 [Rozella allomycis CSF55]RKP19032.1 hypothetical protein ROZALSC1DRAFT_29329 [Rozella allomycis CSF55]|eukprot:EPZ31262.1 hypothetical protein O9G_000907 [Rozella allomycis CSF55]
MKHSLQIQLSILCLSILFGNALALPNANFNACMVAFNACYSNCNNSNAASQTGFTECTKSCKLCDEAGANVNAAATPTVNPAPVQTPTQQTGKPLKDQTVENKSFQTVTPSEGAAITGIFNVAPHEDYSDFACKNDNDPAKPYKMFDVFPPNGVSFPAPGNKSLCGKKIIFTVSSPDNTRKQSFEGIIADLPTSSLDMTESLYQQLRAFTGTIDGNRIPAEVKIFQ